MFLNTTTNSSFNSELCSMMLSANTPISKLKHPEVCNFLFKYTGQTIPDESTIRKYYVSNCYNDSINNIRAYLKNKKLWISIDETTDVESRFVANVLIGTLKLECPGKTFLFNMELLEKTTIVQLRNCLTKPYVYYIQRELNTIIFFYLSVTQRLIWSKPRKILKLFIRKWNMSHV